MEAVCQEWLTNGSKVDQVLLITNYRRHGASCQRSRLQHRRWLASAQSTQDLHTSVKQGKTGAYSMQRRHSTEIDAPKVMKNCSFWAKEAVQSSGWQKTIILDETLR